MNDAEEMDRLVRRFFRRSSLQVVFIIAMAVFTVVSVLIVNGVGTRNGEKTSQENEEVEEKAGLRVDIKYLISLGLPCRPEDVKNVGNVSDCNGKRTINGKTAIATAVKPKETGDAVNLVRNVRHFLPTSDIVVFDLGIDSYERELLAVYCKESEMCLLRKLDDGLPHQRFHVPLAIQTTLSLGYENVVYVSPRQILTSGNLTATLNKLSETGIAGWKMGAVSRPTTSITHPNMFNMLSVRNDDYRFQHAISTDVLAIKNIESVGKNVMLPWIKCVLVPDCISPVGAQNKGCRYDKKPKYRYSGCHEYDTSALNVVLGVFFDFDESKYILSDTDKFFIPVLNILSSTTRGASI